MAIKEIKREWSPCHCGYVKTFLCHYEKDVADLPKCCVGSRAMVSDTDNEYICTASGWVNAAEFDENGNAKGKVILPEMELELESSDGPGENYFMLYTPPNAYPEDGKTYMVNFNGQEYALPATNVDEGGCYAFMHEGENGYFTIAIGANGLIETAGCYVMVITDAESVTLSIVEKPAAVGWGGVFIVHATPIGETDPRNDGVFALSLSVDKTYEEAKEAFRNGSYLAVELSMNEGNISRLTFNSYDAWDGGEGLTFFALTSGVYGNVYWEGEDVWFEVAM